MAFLPALVRKIKNDHLAPNGKRLAWGRLSVEAHAKTPPAFPHLGAPAAPHAVEGAGSSAHICRHLGFLLEDSGEAAVQRCSRGCNLPMPTALIRPVTCRRQFCLKRVEFPPLPFTILLNAML